MAQTSVVTERTGVERPAGGTSLSACLMTAGPAPRVVALLELLRPVAMELVVALDDRADPKTERAIAAAADEVVRYPYREPVDRSLPWLFSLCRGDWILNVDDDEIPGAALLEALPGLVGATDVTHYWLLRRWLWPDGKTAIAEHPWSTDYQLRLVRNDPLLLRFPAETHRPLEALGPHRFLQLPLYHADLLLKPLEQREAKARKYEALRPGKRIGGGPMNHVFHLPERRPGLRTEPLPGPDLELVRAVLEADAAPADGARPATLASAEDVDRVWAGRELGQGDHQARIEILDEPVRLREREQRTFDVLVENLGTTLWPWGERGEPEIRLSYQWLDTAGNVLAHGLRTPLPADLLPGEPQVVPVHVLAPSRAGSYRLRFDLVHEYVRWFGCGVERDVAVERRLRVALLGDEAAVERTLAQLTEQAPEFEPLVLASAPGARFGPPRAPDLRRYLLEGTAHGRLRDLRLLATRAATLARAARRQRAGIPERPLLRGGQEFLDELGASTHLLLAAGTPEVGTRELWLQSATVSAARALGVEPIVQHGALARAHGPLDALLVRSILRRARIVGPGERVAMIEPDLLHDFRGKRVLITGGLGFIGSNLARALVAAQAHVVLLDSLIPEYGGNRANIAGIEDRVTVNVSDVRDPHSLTPLLRGQEVLFNLAGQTSHLDSMTDPFTDLEINCRSQLSILEACRAHNPDVKVVFASTRQIYGRPRYLPVDEQHPVAPVDVNGIDKAAGEAYHLLYGQVHGLRVSALRLTNTYGPGMRVRDARQTFLGVWLKSVLRGEQIEVWGDGSQRRDLLYVDDAVRAFLLAAARGEADGEVFNVGVESSISLRELAELLVRVHGSGSYDLIPFPADRKAIDIGDYFTRGEKIREALGWEAAVELEDGLRRTLAYYAEHGAAYWDEP